MKKGNEIDKLFKEGLESPDIPFNEANWLSLEERLHPKEKRRIVPIIWFAAVAGIAAMLLVVFLFLPKEDQQKRNDQVENKKTGTPQGKNQEQTKKEDQNNNNVKNNEKANQYADVKKTGKEQKEMIVHDKADSENDKLSLNNASNNFIDLKLASTDRTISNNLQSNSQSENLLNVSASQIIFNDQKLNTTLAYAKVKTAPNPIVNKNKPRLVLSILAAPDLTSIQTSGRSNLSGSFGAELTLSVTKRLSITTGAAYAKKIYDSDFSLYRPNTSYVFKVAPTNVHANCDVIDIPLNVNYKVFDNNRNSITVSTGLSSYLMLKEKYSYTYDGSYQRPQDFEVKNQNQHYLGIANIGVEFQHKINNKISIGARPFIKLPLTDIGYGNSKLSSTGVAVSLNMNLFKK
jgi:hypothetical protein